MGKLIKNIIGKTKALFMHVVMWRNEQLKAEQEAYNKGYEDAIRDLTENNIQL
jgi:hypothetical protein